MGHVDTYFIRHKLRGDEVELCDAHRIAIDFDNLPISGDATELGSEIRGAYRTALTYMIHLRDHGGYVFAEYGEGYIGNRRSGDIGCILAKVEPQRRFGAFKPTAKDYEYQVTLELDPSSIGYIRYSEFPVLLAIRPPFSTICRPSRTYPQIAEAFFDRKPMPAQDVLELLHPKMVEQLCVEYLRRRDQDDRLDYCMLRPGKSLAIIDIAGRLVSGEALFAQVKNAPLSADRSSKLAGELERFVCSAKEDNAVGILFGQFKDAQDCDGPISFVDLRDVIRSFHGEDRKVLEDMIGAGDIETDTEGSYSVRIDWAD